MGGVEKSVESISIALGVALQHIALEQAAQDAQVYQGIRGSVHTVVGGRPG